MCTWVWIPADIRRFPTPNHHLKSGTTGQEKGRKFLKVEAKSHSEIHTFSNSSPPPGNQPDSDTTQHCTLCTMCSGATVCPNFPHPNSITLSLPYMCYLWALCASQLYSASQSPSICMHSHTPPIPSHITMCLCSLIVALMCSVHALMLLMEPHTTTLN